MQLLFDQLNAARNAKIDYLLSNYPWKYPDPMFAAIDADAEAPLTTNWKMLEMIGIDPNTATLGEIISGLKEWGVYLINYTPSEGLRSYLLSTVLLEDVPLIPPSEYSKEFIDMSGGNFAGNNSVDAG